MVSRVWLREAGEFIGIGGPVEIAAVYHRAADDVAEAGDVFRSRMEDDVRAPLYRAAERGRREGVVHDERHALAARYARERLERRDVDNRVADGLGENRARLAVDRLLNLAGMVSVDHYHLDAEARQQILEKSQRPAVDLAREDDVRPRLAERRRDMRKRGLPGGERDGADAAFERRERIFEGLHRRVRDARIGEALLLEIKKPLRVSAVVELIGRRSVYGQPQSPRRGVAVPARVQSPRHKAVILAVRHKKRLLIKKRPRSESRAVMQKY